MICNSREKKFSAKKESLTEIQSFVMDFCSSAGIEKTVANKLGVCTDEVISNVIFYSGAAELLIQIEKSEKELFVTFCDDGKAFNPVSESKEPDLTSSAEDRDVGGLGIFLVKKMMDKVSYSRLENKNVFKMSVNL